MKTYLAKLNPAERRFVVGVALMFFIVINIFFVWPHYSDLASWGNRRASAERQLDNYNEKITQVDGIKPQLAKMEGSGADVPQEEQSVQFLQTITRQAALSGVAVTATGRQITRTNSPFFLEQVQTITVQSGEEQLVNFLYGLGQGDSLVRVRDLSVRPDPPRQVLIAQVTLVASYQKAPKVRPAAAPAPTTPVTAPKTSPTAAPQAPPAMSKKLPSPGTSVPKPAIPKKP